MIQPEAAGLCDAIFRAHTVVPADEAVLVGLPDTIWFPDAALLDLPDAPLSFLLFPVERPEFFDAVILDDKERVREIQVKQAGAASNCVWGAFKMPGEIFAALHGLWQERQRSDEFFGTLVNAYLARGGEAVGVKAGQAYVDVGTLNGYRSAISLLADMATQGLGRARNPKSFANPPLRQTIPWPKAKVS